MGRSGMKKEEVVVMMVMIMIVGAQAQAAAAPIIGIPEGPPHRRRCASKCAFRCLLTTRLNPVSFMLCFNLCMVKCKFMPPQSVFNCTSTCATSKSSNAHTDADAENVEGYVESCYNNCKIKQ